MGGLNRGTNAFGYQTGAQPGRGSSRIEPEHAEHCRDSAPSPANPVLQRGGSRGTRRGAARRDSLYLKSHYPMSVDGGLGPTPGQGTTKHPHPFPPRLGVSVNAAAVTPADGYPLMLTAWKQAAYAACDKHSPGICQCFQERVDALPTFRQNVERLKCPGTLRYEAQTIRVVVGAFYNPGSICFSI